MKRFSIVFSAVLLVFGMALPAGAQYRYFGETGARVVRCIGFYQTIASKIDCAVTGNELRAQIRDNIDLVDDISRTGHQSIGFDGGDGWFYQTDASGYLTGARKPMSTIKKVGVGAAIGGGAGYVFFGNGRGTAGGAVAGAIVGLVAGHKSDKKAKQQEEAYQYQLQAEAQAQAEAEYRASREYKLLRNRFDTTVRCVFKSPDGRIEEVVLNAGESIKINPPRGSQLVLAEAQDNYGKWERLEYGRGKVKLPYDAGWEFDPAAFGS